ncbi:MAG: class C sortase [Clostridiales bacterium]|nr:class C sortase [Clostridiales bacterium]
MKIDKVTLILFIILMGGMCLLLYPTASDYWNSFHQSRAIASYVEAVENLSEVDYEKIIQAAQEYNARLYDNTGRWHMTDAEMEEYNSLLDVSGSGIMGYIDIDKINVELPIYHTVEDSVLQVAVGHMPGSSLPVGGTNTHAVLSGHRGLPSARLFTDLDKLTEKDTFVITFLDEKITYEVDQINIVEPTDSSKLAFSPGEDIVTLITCTPYGVNSHRLMIRGHRVANAEEEIVLNVSADANKIDPVVVAPMVAVPILLLLFVVMMVKTSKKGSKKEKKEKKDKKEKNK